MSDSDLINVLLIEDNLGDARLVEMMLAHPGDKNYSLQTADTLSAAKELLDEQGFEVALLDMSLPDSDGIDSIADLKASAPDMAVVVLSGQEDEGFALETVKAGVQDYLVKGKIDEWQLTRALHYAIERKQLQLSMLHMAHHDQLTGLANRTLFRLRLEHAIGVAERRGESVVVLYMDLDHFKPINDGLGHETGDKLLIEISNRLVKIVRGIDTVARLGGDEFAVILEGVKHTKDAAAVAEKIIEMTTKSIDVDQHKLYVGTSIGIAFFPHCGKDVDSIIKNADSAMYKAKRNGRNQYQFYTNEMNGRALEELKQEMQLHEALNREEFLLYYQPILNLKTNKIIGNEALLRWEHPEQGLLYPISFISMLEHNDMITGVGYWVLETACKQHVAWKKQGLPVDKLSINLSGRQLLQADFCHTVSDILKKSGLDAAFLEFELTESLLIQNTDVTMEILETLKFMGVSIAIDDFGTGYNSFSYLKRFLVDTIKIDRSFIENLTDKGPDVAITSAIIRLAKDLGIYVIAEGVETQEQLEFLRAKGIDGVQGNFISEPLPPKAFSHMISSESKVA